LATASSATPIPARFPLRSSSKALVKGFNHETRETHESSF
jgi:hypothetical protein